MKAPIQTTLILYESDLQEYCERYLNDNGIQFFHVPDTFWKWVHRNCSVGIRCWLYKIFGALPDMMIFLPIDDRYTLLINCELKKPGSYLRTAQREAAARLPWVTVKSPEGFEEIINEAKTYINGRI